MVTRTKSTYEYLGAAGWSSSDHLLHRLRHELVRVIIHPDRMPRHAKPTASTRGKAWVRYRRHEPIPPTTDVILAERFPIAGTGERFWYWIDPDGSDLSIIDPRPPSVEVSPIETSTDDRAESTVDPDEQTKQVVLAQKISLDDVVRAALPFLLLDAGGKRVRARAGRRETFLL